MAPGSRSQFLLRWTDEDGVTRQQELPSGELTIGRSPSCGLVVPDPGVSNTHARIQVDDGSVVVHDLDSRNGTFVNGERVRSERVQPGDRIKLGDRTLVLVTADWNQTLPAQQEPEEGVPRRTSQPLVTQPLPTASPADGGARYVLSWQDPDGVPAEQELPPGELTIGRSSDCGLVLPDPHVSGRHACLRVEGDAVVINDLGSRNGTFVNGERVTSAQLGPGDQISVGGSTFLLVRARQDSSLRPGRVGAGGAALPTVPAPTEPVRVPARHVPGVVPDELLSGPIISEQALAAVGVEVQVAEYAALGGGLGSFVWVDWLRNAGVSASDVLVVGAEERPHAHYARLCQHSQIPLHERLRSNSDSCPDNVWGFPGYAVREAWGDLTRGSLARAVSTMWQIFGEPAIAQTYTPRSGDVFRALDREAERIGWRQMLRRGRVRNIRKSDQGRLVAIVSESDERRRKHFAVSARFLHLAVGYPALQFLPDLGDYRERHEDRSRVVNAYEPHDHVYTQLRQQGGTVLLRGRGIVASRIIQRLWEERQRNRGIRIVHLHRSRIVEGHRFGRSRRAVEEQVEFQPFNWPKGCWTGEQRQLLEESSDEERKRLLDIWGGTTTARRRDWRGILAEGAREGWYRSEFGAVREVMPTEDGRVLTRIQSSLEGGGVLELPADFIIDCTGLIAAPERSRLLADLVSTYQLPLNKLGRLKVSNDFEVAGLRHGEGRCYAAGATTLGGPHAAVDSFLGLQYAALRAMDSIQRMSPKGLRRLKGLYSFGQWLKWARGVAP